VYYADSKPGNPFRVAVDSPYRSAHAIFVKDGAVSKTCQSGQIPEIVQTYLLSIRVFDANNMMVDADVCEDDQIEQRLVKFMANDEVEYLHLHTARRGFFSLQCLHCIDLYMSCL
jgi:hypothetical protein